MANNNRGIEGHLLVGNVINIFRESVGSKHSKIIFELIDPNMMLSDLILGKKLHLVKSNNALHVKLICILKDFQEVTQKFQEMTVPQLRKVWNYQIKLAKKEQDTYL